LLAQGRGFAVVFFNIDRLRDVCVWSGHSKGDLAIQEVAFEVRRALPKEGRVYRIIGGEFGVLLPGMNEQQASAWAETVRKAVEAEVKVVDSKLGPRSLTVRAAVTEHLPTRPLWSKKDQTPLIMAINGALVEARLRGGNCVVTRPVGALLESERER
jgi:diguanylate cyclase (GGDEF)-like protein